MKISKHYGEGGRLSKAADAALVESAYKHDCEDADIMFPYLTYANLSYAIMLAEAGIIPEKPANKIISELINIHETYDFNSFDINPKNGDIYNNYDVLLREKIGKEAGWLHTGRPRREAVNVAFVLVTRETWLDLANNLVQLIESVIKVSTQHLNTLMPDFTYLHHAQPTSLAHYLLTFVSTAIRDLERLKQAYKRLNVSTGGSGSVNGSSLPLSKKRLKELLSFDDIAVHSRDAMWMPDIPFELIQVVSSIMMNWSRLAEEIQIWSTREFDFIELPDSLCRASVIMPHKKNPYPVAYFRGLTTQIINKISAYGTYGKIFSGNPDSRIFIYGDLPKTIIKAGEALDLLNKVIKESIFKTDSLKKSLKNDFSAATDIADHLIYHKKVDYRSAHQIVGRIVKKLNEENIGFPDFNTNDLSAISKEVTGRTLKISKSTFKKIIDPATIVNSRTTTGGAAEKEVKKMTQHYKKSLRESKKWLKDKTTIIENLKSNLIDEARRTL